jgi:beta-N-acetylhexosaminidase
MITRYSPGGVLLTGRSTAGVAATSDRTAAMQRAATAASGRAGLFVAVDQEGGRVQVLSGPGFSAIPSAATQGNWSPKQLQNAANQWGRELQTAGVNVDLAPVGDVLSATLGHDNGPIGRYDRAFATEPEVVASHVTAFIQGMHAAGVSTTVKHFPGLGRVRDNTDYSSHVTDNETTANDPALLPFSAAVRAGTTFVMISSATYSKIDPGNLAVFSHIVLRRLVRDTLGFSGIIVSDDLGQAAEVAAVPPAYRAVAFLDAGGDMVLTADALTTKPMIDALLEKSHHDQRFGAVVAAAERRVLNAKLSHGLLTCPNSSR